MPRVASKGVHGRAGLAYQIGPDDQIDVSSTPVPFRPEHYEDFANLILARPQNGKRVERWRMVPVFGAWQELYGRNPVYKDGAITSYGQKSHDFFLTDLPWREANYPPFGPRGVCLADQFVAVHAHPTLRADGTAIPRAPCALGVGVGGRVIQYRLDGSVEQLGRIPGTLGPLDFSYFPPERRVLLTADTSNQRIIRTDRSLAVAARTGEQREDGSLWTHSELLHGGADVKSVRCTADGTMFFAAGGKIWRQPMSPDGHAIGVPQMFVDWPASWLDYTSDGELIAVSITADVRRFSLSGAISRPLNPYTTPDAGFVTCEVDRAGYCAPFDTISVVAQHWNNSNNNNITIFGPDHAEAVNNGYPAVGFGSAPLGRSLSEENHYGWLKVPLDQGVYLSQGTAQPVPAVFVPVRPTDPDEGDWEADDAQLYADGHAVHVCGTVAGREGTRPSFLAQMGPTGIGVLGVHADTLADLPFGEFVSFAQAGMRGNVPRPELRGYPLLALHAFYARGSQRWSLEGKPLIDAIRAFHGHAARSGVPTVPDVETIIVLHDQPEGSPVMSNAQVIAALVAQHTAALTQLATLDPNALTQAQLDAVQSAGSQLVATDDQLAVSPVQQPPPPPPPSGNAATFVQVDAATVGDWRSRYGARGVWIAGETQGTPAGIAINGGGAYVWAASSAETRALARATSGRIMACNYGDAFSVDCNLTAQVALYLLDGDSNARSVRIDAIDGVTQRVLATHDFASFHGGVYAVFSVIGHVVLRVSKLGGANAVISGIFVDGALVVTQPAGDPPPAGVPVFKGSISAAAAVTPPGSWVRVDSDNIAPSLFDPVSPNRFSYNFCGVAPWNDVAQSIDLVGMGHGGAPGLSRYRDATNRWDDRIPCTGSHGYDMTATVNGRIFRAVFGTASPTYPWMADAGIYEWNDGKFDFFCDPPETGWGQLIAHVAMVGWEGSVQGMPSALALYCSNSGAVHLLNLANKGWTTRIHALVGQEGYYGSVIAYSRQRNCIVFGGGNVSTGSVETRSDNRRLVRMDADFSVTPMPDAPHHMGIEYGMQFTSGPDGNFYALGYSELWRLDTAWSKLGALPPDVLNANEEVAEFVTPTPFGIVVTSAAAGRTPENQMHLLRLA